MRTFVASDHHFGQESFHRYIERFQDTMRPDYPDASTWVEAYIEAHNSVVPEFDSTVYFLGDLARNINWAEAVMSKLNGQYKYLVMGNHDAKFPTFRLQKLFDKLMGVTYLMGKKYLLTHVPVHPQELRGMINIHGHVHKYTIDDDRYINVCVDHMGLKPLEIFNNG